MICRGFLILGLVWSGFSFGQEKFSETVWRAIDPIYFAIRQHPFNQKFQDGTLPGDIFDYYLAQDAIYLTPFAQSLEKLATKLSLAADQERIRKLISEISTEEKRPRPIAQISPSTLFYTNYLLNIAAYGSKEELAAGLLPCYWIYLRLGSDIQLRTPAPHPFTKWLATYRSAKYQESVEFMIHLVDRLAEATSSDTRQKMRIAFVTASRMEWYFWEAAYQKEAWKP